MSKKTVLIIYFFLLILAAACLLVVMPKEINFPNGVTLSRPNLGRDVELKEGLDIKGGTQVTLAADMSGVASERRQEALENARDVISRRIDLYGVSEASVKTARSQEEYRLIVEIPGITNGQDAIKLIGSTARLDFREFVGTNSANMQVSDFKPTGLAGQDLYKASVQFDSGNSKPGVSLEFTGEGRDKFAAITKRNIGKPLAIFLDEYPITSPLVKSQISDGKAQISGEFTLSEAKSLTIALNAGALPVPISIIGQKTVGATLGQAAINQALRAGILGVAMVFLFIVLLYGFRGLLACISLVFYGLLTLALYKLIPVTLSIAGVAGFLLSVGMAVDTNILVFERLKEEGQVGIGRAFARAFNAIKDANMTTLLTCFVLYNPFEWDFLNRFGVVRGFALTLALGILINIFCGMLVTRVLLILFTRESTHGH